MYCVSSLASFNNAVHAHKQISGQTVQMLAKMN